MAGCMVKCSKSFMRQNCATRFCIIHLCIIKYFIYAMLSSVLVYCMAEDTLISARVRYYYM